MALTHTSLGRRAVNLRSRRLSDADKAGNEIHISQRSKQTLRLRSENSSVSRSTSATHTESKVETLYGRGQRKK